MSNGIDDRTCPFCGEPTWINRQQCRNCGKQIPNHPWFNIDNNERTRQKGSINWSILAIFFIIFICFTGIILFQGLIFQNKPDVADFRINSVQYDENGIIIVSVTNNGTREATWVAVRARGTDTMGLGDCLPRETVVGILSGIKRPRGLETSVEVSVRFYWYDESGERQTNVRWKTFDVTIQDT